MTPLHSYKFRHHLSAQIFASFICMLKLKQPHPNPPLLPQGRELIAASTKLPDLHECQ